MSLVAGFHANVQIRDNKDQVLYECPYNSEEQVKAFVSQYGKSKKSWGFLKGLAITLRPNQAKDFFVPSFVHSSSKIHSTSLKIFATLLLLPIDMVTMPVRLISLPFRLYYLNKHPEAKHPALDLIPNFKDSIIQIHCETEQTQINPPENPDDEGNVFQTAAKIVTNKTFQVIVKKMPGKIKEKSSESKVHTSYLGLNGEWTIENSFNSSSSNT